MINLVLRHLSLVATDGSVMMAELVHGVLLGCDCVKWLLSLELAQIIP